LPTKLPSGLIIYNVCAHDLHFWCGRGDGTITAPSDGVINSLPVIHKVSEHNGYILTSIDYARTVAGDLYIKRIREECPEALIIGSIITAQAYIGDVVAPVPLRSVRRDSSSNLSIRLNRSNRFATFEKQKEEVTHHG
jgi:hypothetical protein